MPMSEGHILDPLSPYGAGNVAGEVLVSSYGKFGKIQKAISLRFFNVYGVGQTLEYAGVITKFAERLSKGLRPIIYGDGQQTRDFVSCPVASGKSISINDLAKTMIRISGLDEEERHKICSSRYDNIQEHSGICCQRGVGDRTKKLTLHSYHTNFR
jgi:dTDP-D-glucose 4,6-dehydratase